MGTTCAEGRVSKRRGRPLHARVSSRRSAADKGRAVINPVFVPTGVLFGGALLEIVLGGVLSRTAKGWLAFLAAAIALTAALAMIPASIHGEVLTATLLD